MNAEPLDQVELWFVRRGVPQVIAEYNAVTDVFTRMVPWFVIVFVFGSFATFGDRFTGWSQALVFAVAVVLLLVAAGVLNVVRGRSFFDLPKTIGLVEVVLLLIGSPAIALLFSDSGSRVRTAVFLLILNAVLLVVGYVITSYALFPMIRWGARQMIREIRGVFTLLARTLPLLLLFATFIFINAEMWQVAHELTGPLAVLVIGLLVVVASGFLLLRLPTELADLLHFDSWRQIVTTAEASLAPINLAELPADPPVIPGLGTRERLNLTLLIFIAELVQMVLVAVVIGLFYVVFGLLTVREETLLQWTEITPETFAPLARLQLFGAELVVTRELFLVAGFIAAISALQFATSQLTDESYRAEFSADVETELREVLAVRAAYLHRLAGPIRL